MDLEKIGRFIAISRKKKNLTQMELANKLGVTDRAVSKWERGKAMPDSSIMLPLCNALSISVNELLLGEEIEMEESNKQMEQSLLEMLRQKEESDKRLLRIEVFLIVISMLFLAGMIAIIFLLEMPFWAKIVIAVIAVLQFLVSGLVCFRIEQKAGYYECDQCHHEFIPTYVQSIFSPHIGLKKYMKCPKCGKRSYCHKNASKKQEK